jgi:hypothetical protein
MPLKRLALALTLALASAPTLARAQTAAPDAPAAPSDATSETSAGSPPTSLPLRIGVHPLVGVGLAKLSNTGPFPNVIGLTTLGGDLHVERPPYGGFFRLQFHSSGLDGRWTAPSFALGASYRLYGDSVETFGILARAGVLWERWHATNANCPIDLFVPSNCKALAPPSPTGVILNQGPIVTQTADMFGLLAGVRAEMPIRFLYLAADFEASGVADFGDGFPGTLFQARVAVLAGFRDLANRGGSGPRRRQDRRSY